MIAYQDCYRYTKSELFNIRYKDIQIMIKILVVENVSLNREHAKKSESTQR